MSGPEASLNPEAVDLNTQLQDLFIAIPIKEKFSDPAVANKEMFRRSRSDYAIFLRRLLKTLLIKSQTTTSFKIKFEEVFLDVYSVGRGAGTNGEIIIDSYEKILLNIIGLNHNLDRQSTGGFFTPSGAIATERILFSDLKNLTVGNASMKDMIEFDEWRQQFREMHPTEPELE